LPLVAVLTDYAPHSYWLYDEVDYYIVPSEEARERLIQKGVAEEKIRLLGIPIDLKFLTAGDRGIIFKKFNLNPDLKTVLIMGGGHGLGDIVSITRRLDKEISQNFQMIVVAGINRKVSLKLRKERIKFSKSLLVFDFIQNVNELMDICDIIVTKAGGITTAESLAKGLAMIVTKSIPGQEMNNTKFLADQNISVIANNSDEVIAAVKHLIRDEATLATLRTKAGGLGRPQAALDIARLILEA
jgi:processive 1,2-diacylglycerol beta-glucosyltransferase